MFMSHYATEVCKCPIFVLSILYTGRSGNYFRGLQVFSEIRRPQLLSLINTITYIFVFMHEKHYVCIA